MCNSDVAPHAASASYAGPSLDDQARTLACLLRDAAAGGGEDVISAEALGELFAALCALVSSDAQTRGSVVPLRIDAGANATAVLTTATALLRGANLELFELGMWQSWSGMK